MRHWTRSLLVACVRRQTITWAQLRYLRSIFNDIWIKMRTFSFKKMHFSLRTILFGLQHVNTDDMRSTIILSARSLPRAQTSHAPTPTPRVKYMMTPSNGNIFRITGPLCGELTGHRWIPLTKTSDAELWCFLWSAPEKRFSKQSRRRWFETPSHSLWRHCNEKQIPACRWSGI